ncbi:MAG TPA: DNA alkylation repair protein [Oscillospiraceae bacterium]|nr:DNA alkylation repair protein [Oscillospiraceae bacterium]HXK77945.1 DNA alkylation repair protein [Oscillospiraceae bacterium]
MEETIRTELFSLAEPDYAAFSGKLIPQEEHLLGVRVPILRRMAKELCKADWRHALSFGEDLFFEETMLRGMVIAGAAMPTEERLRYTMEFLPRIRNWSVCDSFCASFRDIGKNRQIYLHFLTPLLADEREFTVRFAEVMLLDHFVEPEFVPALLELYGSVRHSGSYAKMACAWGIATCYAAAPEETECWLLQADLDRETFRLALKKIAESFRTRERGRELYRIYGKLPSGSARNASGR